MKQITFFTFIGGMVALAVGLVYTGWRVYRTEIYMGLTSGTPPSEKWFFDNSDVIAYVEVLEVDRKIVGSTETLPLEKKAVDRLSLPESAGIIEIPPVGKKTIFPKQHVKVKFLKVLKGPEKLENTTTNIIKGKAFFYLTQKERLVLYLRRTLPLCSYRVVSPFKEESRLALALANVNTLKKDRGSGIVVGVLNKGTLEVLKVYVLQGRQKAPIVLDSEIYKDNFKKGAKIGEFDIAEIPLEPGSYTVLIELEGSLYSFNRLVDGYYPYVVLEENNWQGLYFDVSLGKK